MKGRNTLIKAVTFLLLLALSVFALAACGPEDTGSDEENLCLVNGGKVNFSIVVSSDLDEEGIAQVKTLIGELRDLGLDIPEEPVKDTETDKIRDCEIIFGTKVNGREGCSVDEHQIGTDGYIIKIVGDRVIVAAGSAESFADVMGIFKKKVMGITSKVDTLADATVKVERKYTTDRGTVYPIADILIGSESLANFHLSFDASNEYVKAAANKLREEIYERSGYWLPLESELSEGKTAEHKFIIRSVSDLGKDNFKVYASGADLIMETSWEVKLMTGVEKFIEKYLDISVPVTRFYVEDVYKYDIKAIRYADHGAVGDGKTDDFLAIFKAHQEGNQTGTKVMADEGKKTYYLGESSYGKSIEILTDVDFGEATFIIDDTSLAPNAGNGVGLKPDLHAEDLNTLYRGYFIFEIKPTVTFKKYTSANGDFPSGMTLSETDTALPEGLRTLITDECMAIVYNTEHRIYVRHGPNKYDNPQHEVLLINADGTIKVDNTPVMWNYENIDELLIYHTSDAPITVEGGRFETRANQIYNGFTQSDLNDGWAKDNQYYYYNRSIRITRSNVTLKGIEHYIKNEADKGYPYGGWFMIEKCDNTYFEDCVMTGHKAYLTPSNNTTMGTYEICINRASNITFKNCRQSNSITDTDYWGVMCGNFGRNITYDGCTLSRFDAHEGFYNATVKNTTLGHSFSVVGKGTVLAENVKKYGEASATLNFLTFRGDYGSFWDGDIIIKNCSIESTGKTLIAVNIVKGNWHTDWKAWDFGYELCMPTNVTVENFTTPSDPEARLNVFSWENLSAESEGILRYTKNIYIINQEQKLHYAPSGTYLDSVRKNINISVTGTGQTVLY